jgi:hypothetical protein
VAKEAPKDDIDNDNDVMHDDDDPKDRVAIDVSHGDGGVGGKLEPVPFFSLFRYSTPLEKFLDIIGIICAVCSGAAQVRARLSPTTVATALTFMPL